jgi:hypothetical protein
MIQILTEVWWIFFQGELIFLFIISISLHKLRIVSGLFWLNNDNSFNALGLLKYFGIRFFLSVTKFVQVNVLPYIKNLYSILFKESCKLTGAKYMHCNLYMYT